jgi:hypothetical protein
MVAIRAIFAGLVLTIGSTCANIEYATYNAATGYTRLDHDGTYLSAVRSGQPVVAKWFADWFDEEGFNSEPDFWAIPNAPTSALQHTVTTGPNGLESWVLDNTNRLRCVSGIQRHVTASYTYQVVSMTRAGVAFTLSSFSKSNKYICGTQTGTSSAVVCSLMDRCGATPNWFLLPMKLRSIEVRGDFAIGLSNDRLSIQYMKLNEMFVSDIRQLDIAISGTPQRATSIYYWGLEGCVINTNNILWCYNPYTGVWDRHGAYSQAVYTEHGIYSIDAATSKIAFSYYAYNWDEEEPAAE